MTFVCDHCGGSGRVPCEDCRGTGDRRADPDAGPCQFCGGLRTRRCKACEGVGLIGPDGGPARGANR